MSRPSPGRDSNSPHIALPPNFSLSHSPSRPESTSYSRGQHTTEIRDLSSCAGYIVQATPTHSPVHPHPMSEPMLHDVAMESPVRDESGRRGSPSSSSQGELGDSDMDSGPSSQQDHTTGQTSNQQVKKKRTRTLTTPHQSAVLHALLAQVSSASPSINTAFLTRCFSHVSLLQLCEKRWGVKSVSARARFK